MKTYNARMGRTTGSTGFSNFAGEVDLKTTLEEVFLDHPDGVVVDGDEDWFVNPLARPVQVCARMNITPLAFFHTGVSGLANSGVVLSVSDFNRIVNDGVEGIAKALVKEAYTGNANSKRWGQECMLGKIFEWSAYTAASNMKLKVDGGKGSVSVEDNALDEVLSQDMGR